MIHRLRILIFTARVCQHPGDIPNGIRRGNVFVYGSQVIYQCELGYRLEGRNSRTCQANGQWSGALPLCKGKGTLEHFVVRYSSKCLFFKESTVH